MHATKKQSQNHIWSHTASWGLKLDIERDHIGLTYSQTPHHFSLFWIEFMHIRIVWDRLLQVQADTRSPLGFSESKRFCTYFMHVKSKIACSIFGTRFIDHLVSCLPEKCLALRARNVSKCTKRVIKPTSPGDFQTSEGADTLILGFLAVVPRILQIGQASNVESSELLVTNNKWLCKYDIC